MAKRFCGEIRIAGQCAVQLLQGGRDNFTIVYGAQMKSRLSYAQAAMEFGACAMHAMACADLLDNEPSRSGRARSGHDAHGASPAGFGERV